MTVQAQHDEAHERVDRDPATQAFEAFFRAHYRDVVRLAHSVLGDGQAVQDVAQDVFLAALRRFPGDYALVCASGIGVMFGAFAAGSTPQAVATIPEIIWEASVGLYLTFKGFRTSAPILAESEASEFEALLAVAAV